mmetsp:Transcript_10849/g.27849  ORF Transcript_10849/g.27849 Transcript_10849/m.27849 type:complete len:202 (-) Transcript_10849:227-832(-)
MALRCGVEDQADAISCSDFFCISRSMLRKPLFREGVRLCFRPSASMKSASSATISSGVQSLRPCTSSAASPLVSCESESAAQNTFPSRSSGFTHTCETQPVTLLSSVWSSAAIGCSLAAKNSSCLYLALGSGTIWNEVTIFFRLGGSSAPAWAQTICELRRDAARTGRAMAKERLHRASGRVTECCSGRWVRAAQADRAMR